MKQLVDYNYIDTVLSDFPTSLYRRYTSKIHKLILKKRYSDPVTDPVWPRGWVKP